MTQEATIIEFKNDDQRAMFQLRMALVMLQSEVRIGMPITSRAKANTLHVISILRNQTKSSYLECAQKACTKRQLQLIMPSTL